MPARSSRNAFGSGFTLLELLIVIAIITILITLSMAVAFKVTATGKRHATEQTLRVLDTALNAFIQGKGANPAAYVLDPRPGNTGNTQYVLPVVDGRNFSDTGNAVINSVALFVLQCKDSPEANAALKNVDPKFLHDYDPDVLDSPNANGVWTQQPNLPTVFDAWGHPIRYVHPAFKGLLIPSNSQPDQPVNTVIVLPLPSGKQYGILQIRRNGSNTVTPPVNPADSADSDGGVSTAARPYFYSAGPDGLVGVKIDPSTGQILEDYNADNIYLTAPKFQKAN